MAGRREDEVRKRKRRILEAATELISEGGTEACTMRALAKKARVDVTTLYNHYTSKEDILEALRRSGARKLRAHFDELPETEPLSRIRGIVHLTLGVRESPPDLARPINLVRTRRLPGTGPMESVARELLVVELERAQDQGLLRRELEPELLALSILEHFRVWLPVWAMGLVDFEEAEARVDFDLGLCLLAAATEKTRSRLEAELLESQERLLERRREPEPAFAGVPQGAV